MKFETVTIGATRVPWPVLAAAIAAAPLLCVVTYRTLKHQPAPDSAIELVEAAAFSPADDIKPTPAAMALVSQFSTEASRGFGPSPMISRAPAAPVRPAFVPEPAQTAPDAAPILATANPPGIELTSIMAGAKGQAIAVINGKLRRTGDNVGNGFVVSLINLKTGEVEIQNQAGDHAVFQLKKRPD